MNSEKKKNAASPSDVNEINTLGNNSQLVVNQNTKLTKLFKSIDSPPIGAVGVNFSDLECACPFGTLSRIASIKVCDKQSKYVRDDRHSVRQMVMGKPRGLETVSDVNERRALICPSRETCRCLFVRIGTRLPFTLYDV